MTDPAQPEATPIEAFALTNSRNFPAWLANIGDQFPPIVLRFKLECECG